PVPSRPHRPPAELGQKRLLARSAARADGRDRARPRSLVVDWPPRDDRRRRRLDLLQDRTVRPPLRPAAPAGGPRAVVAPPRGLLVRARPRRPPGRRGSRPRDAGLPRAELAGDARALSRLEALAARRRAAGRGRCAARGAPR